MKKDLQSFSDSLWEAFINDEQYNAQAEERIWAVFEGFQRKYRYDCSWSTVSCARKEHRCVRGHVIKPGDKYFERIAGGCWGGGWKLCAGCMAMHLYFSDVDKLTPYMATHWDFQKEETVIIRFRGE